MTHPFPVVSSGIDPVLYIYTIMIIIHTTEKSNRKNKNLFLRGVPGDRQFPVYNE